MRALSHEFVSVHDALDEGKATMLLANFIEPDWAFAPREGLDDGEPNR